MISMKFIAFFLIFSAISLANAYPNITSPESHHSNVTRKSPKIVASTVLVAIMAATAMYALVAMLIAAAETARLRHVSVENDNQFTVGVRCRDDNEDFVLKQVDHGHSYYFNFSANWQGTSHIWCSVLTTQSHKITFPVYGGGAGHHHKNFYKVKGDNVERKNGVEDKSPWVSFQDHVTITDSFKLRIMNTLTTTVTVRCKNGNENDKFNLDANGDRSLFTHVENGVQRDRWICYLKDFTKAKTDECALIVDEGDGANGDAEIEIDENSFDFVTRPQGLVSRVMKSYKWKSDSDCTDFR